MTTGAMAPAPFVNAELMQRYMNNHVRLVGKLADVAPGQDVTVQTSDNRLVKVTPAPNGAPYGRAEVVEVMGIVTGPDTLSEVMHVDYVQPQGKEFNMANYDKMVHIAAVQQGVFS